MKIIALLVTITFSGSPLMALQKKVSSLSVSSCRIGQINHLGPDAKFGEICEPKILSSEDTALVIVDAWYQPDEENHPIKKSAQKFVHKIRDHGFFVIHGMGRIAFKEPQYLKFRKEVKEFLGKDFCKRWTTIGGKNYQKVYGYLNEPMDCALILHSEYSNVKSGLIYPVESPKEFIVYYEDDMRYVLFKNKIKNLIYIGGALDECILHRSYGINVLKGTDEHKSEFNIFLIKDFLSVNSSAIPAVSDEIKTAVLTHSLSQKITEFFESKNVRFIVPAIND